VPSVALAANKFTATTVALREIWWRLEVSIYKLLSDLRIFDELLLNYSITPGKKIV
jgi:hypothetical protein